MRRILTRFTPVLILFITIPFLLGSGGGEGEEDERDRDDLGKLLHLIAVKVNRLDARVDALEECACQEERQECGGESGMTCADGSFCAAEAGSCENAGAGFCEEIPEVCPDNFAPVCGCDGVTYVNDCERRAGGASLDFEGRCDEAPIACESDAECGDDSFCRTEPATCGMKGVCQAIPMICPQVFEPVCGCDGSTYANKCFAAASGTSVGLPGSCAPLFCDNTAEGQCEKGESCFFRPGICDKESSGICVPTPEVCPDVIDPVCGCDGNTFGNACLALVKGAEIASHGACESVEPKPEKVAVCHKDSRFRRRGPHMTLYIDADSVSDHLGHGDSLGPCDDDTRQRSRSRSGT